MNGREFTNPIAQWFQFFKVHNFYANKTTRQIEHYLRNYRIRIVFRGREVTSRSKLRNLYFILLPNLTQSRLQPNTWKITFSLTREEINTWRSGTPFNFQGNDEDIFGLNNREEDDLKIRPRFVAENFRSRHTQFEIQNEWEIQDLDKFLDIMRKPIFGLLKKWLGLHEGILVNFCVTATYEREGQREIIASEPMHLQTGNYVFLRESN